MSIASDIARLQTAKASLKTVIESKGVTVPSATKLDGYAALVSEIDGGGGSDTPDGYTRLQYLESSGTQAIDTGKYLKLNSKLACDCHYLTGNQGSYAFMFGSASPIVGAMVVDSSTYPVNRNNGYWSFGDKSDKITSPEVLPYIRGMITLNKDSGTVEYSGYSSTKSTVTIGATTVSENQNSHICLFCRGNNGSYERFAKCRIYEYWYYEGDTLIQHMIPLMRNSDSVLGMYDLESDTFFTNVGSGVFAGG